MTGRRVYFSFHYKGDVWRATIVRKAGAINDRVQGGWVDASLWEETKRAGPDAVQALIEDGLNGTSVTVVLIGAETAERPWVKYEIKRSIERGNGLIGVRIHSLRDQEGHRGWLNPPVPQLMLDQGSRVYRWSPQAFGGQVERAAIRAGKPCLAHKKKGCRLCRFIVPIW